MELERYNAKWLNTVNWLQSWKTRRYLIFMMILPTCCILDLSYLIIEGEKCYLKFSSDFSIYVGNLIFVFFVYDKRET